MEIRDYLYVLGRRIWVLLLIPLVAALVAFLVLDTQAQKYDVKARVTVPGAVAGTANAGTTAVYIATFEQAITSDAVLRTVSGDTGLSESRIQNDVSASQVGTSNLIEVTATDQSADVARKLAPATSRATVDLLSKPQLAAAQRGLDGAQAQYDRDRGALDTWVNQNGVVLPDDQYRALVSEVSQLGVEMTDARLSGFGSRAAALQAEITHRQSDLQRLSTQTLQYQRLQDKVNTSLHVLDGAQQRLHDTDADVAEARSTSAVTISKASPVSRLSSIGKGVGVAAVIGFGLALGIVLLPDLLQAPQESEPEGEGGPEQRGRRVYQSPAGGRPRPTYETVGSSSGA